MRKKRTLFITILFLLSVGTSNLCYAQEAYIKLTDIKVSNSNSQTLIDIRTNQPVDFLHYNLKNPPRLVIDFVGTNIYSQEPEVLIFERGNVREIKSVLYSLAEDNPKIDSLVLKFKPNVAVRIRRDSNRILLQVKEHSVISKANDFDNAKRIRANLLASRIAENKKTNFIADSSQNYFGIADAYSPVTDFIVASSIDKITLPGTYMWSLYEDSIKEKMQEFAALDDITLFSAENNKQTERMSNAKMASLKTTFTKNETKEAGLGSSPLRIGLNFLLIISLISLIGYKLKLGAKAISHQKQLPDVDEILSDVRLKPVERYNFKVNQEVSDDNLVEKRRYARFNLPDDDMLTVYMDVEIEGFDKIKTKAKDLSLGGIRIEIDGRVRLPEVLELELRLPEYDKSSEVLARIEWVNPTSESTCSYGFSFMMLGEDEENKIKDFLKNNF
ncbi:MAG: PilZ domain-containing protein [Candidatus Kappaea frigidicola]|nr:PilZ domain-containing protein [Candidatus Kappaea frigidicola]